MYILLLYYMLLLVANGTRIIDERDIQMLTGKARMSTKVNVKKHFSRGGLTV